jgi:uncharacterized membrane protein YkvA (DUF1232 family)
MAKTRIRKKWPLKQEILTLFYAFNDTRTPWYAKLTSLSSLIYLLSPADLIPDIIPFAGYIDDLFVVPFLVNIATRLLPADVKTTALEKAKKKSKKLLWLFILLILVIIAILTLFFFLGNKLFSYFSHSWS